MGRRGRTAKRKTTTKGNKKERKKSTKTKGGKVEVMASFGIFLQLAILCFFTVSKVRAKHFMVETEGDVGDVEGGDYQDKGDTKDKGDNGGSTQANATVNHTGPGSGTGFAQANCDESQKGPCIARARCLCDCPPADVPEEAIAIAECECICNGKEGKFGIWVPEESEENK